MSTGSRIYHYESDRCLVAEEHFAFQGWGRDIRLQDINQKVFPEEDAMESGQHGKKKRRRGQLKGYEKLATDLAGNGMTLPDLASFLLPLLYSLETDIFSATPDCDRLFAEPVSGSPRPCAELDPNMNNASMKKAFESFTSV